MNEYYYYALKIERKKRKEGKDVPRNENEWKMRGDNRNCTAATTRLVSRDKY